VAKEYRLSAPRRLINRLVHAAARRGWGPREVRLLTVAGRRSGRPYTTPVHMVEAEGGRFVVAPYGPVGWVRNLRATGRATLARGSHAETVGAVEVGPEEAAPVLRRYLADVAVTRPYFDVTADSPLEDIAAEAGRHPVFRLVPPPGDAG
jgi:deazaflavin-dependent oxidoreductase (nitroreductase family)